MKFDPVALLVLIPALPILLALIQGVGGLPPNQGKWALRGIATSLGLSALAAGWLLVAGPGQWRWTPLADSSPVALTLRLDAVSVTMAFLVSLVGVSVIRFSRNYLAGDPHQERFFVWTSATLGAVLLLVLSGNLLVLWLAWVATSLCLHRLLVFYPERSAALFAARKKFVFSRLGDACLLAALIILYQSTGTLEMGQLFDMVAAGELQGIAAVSWLLVACALLKSAQFPFHGWLPDTMETPTPVSALMHAGIINAGGFLVIRLSPLLVEAGPALLVLAGVGGFTAAFGAVVMLVQPSVKRALAFSTIAQMGFMLVQCGLGAFGLALIHIVAHSLYKAHAFLRSGSTLMLPARAAVPLRWRDLALGLLVGTFAMLTAKAAVSVWQIDPPPVALILVAILALSYGWARVAANASTWRWLGLTLLASFLLSGLVLILHGMAGVLFSELPKDQPPIERTMLVSTIFIGLFLIQSFVGRSARTVWGRRFYIHALNGFYVGTWGNRLLNQLWPPHPIASPAVPSRCAAIASPATSQETAL